MKWLTGGLAIVLLAATVGPASARDCTEANHKVDKPRMELAFGTGILRNDRGSSVFISERYWRRLTFAQKTDFAQALSCAVAGVGKALSTIQFRSDMTGKVIGEWHLGNLTTP